MLTFIAGAKPGENFPLGPDGDTWVAGRSDDADLVIEDDTVSRKHVRFYQSRGALWLRDLGSRNGTQVNGRAVQHRRLKVGDRITIGANLLKVESVDASRLTTPSTRSEEGTASGRSMSGSIQDIPLADVLQWLATSRKTGTLRVRGRSIGELFLRQGTIYYARIQGSDALAAEKALLRMMSWSEGTFELDNITVELPAGEELSVSLEHILMEAARVQDELAHLGAKNKIPEHRVELKFPPKKAWRDLKPDQLDLVQAVAEGLDWGGVLNRLVADDVAVTRTAIDLLKAGVIEY